ncbi:MAG: hypothetical protein ACT4O2_06335 [Beijerinckiaceae bacterium]
MTIHPTLLLASIRALLRPGAPYDAGTRDLVDDLYRGLDGGLGALPGAESVAAGRRGARAAFAKRLRTPGASFSRDEMRLLGGGGARVLNLAEGT